MYKEKWKEFGYTDEQAEALERLSKIGGDMGDVDVHVADKTISEAMRKYEKENKSMSNTANLGNDFKEKLTDACDKFSQWMESSKGILDAFNAVKAGVESIKELDNTIVEIQKVNEDTINELNNKSCLDVVEIDLEEVGYDLSQWEEDVKPVKAILSINIPDWSNLKTNTFDMKLVGHLIFLMEDGTFRMNQ